MFVDYAFDRFMLSALYENLVAWLNEMNAYIEVTFLVNQHPGYELKGIAPHIPNLH